MPRRPPLAVCLTSAYGEDGVAGILCKTESLVPLSGINCAIPIAVLPVNFHHGLTESEHWKFLYGDLAILIFVRFHLVNQRCESRGRLGVDIKRILAKGRNRDGLEPQADECPYLFAGL